MILFDATHTSHTTAQTGIQQVCRALASELQIQEPLVSVCFDPYQRAWRKLDSEENSMLGAREFSGSSRGARWPWSKRLMGKLKDFAGSKPDLPVADSLICAELFSASVGLHLPELFRAVRGPRVAIFHDALALKYPEFTPKSTVARCPAYLRELLQFDAIAAVSNDSGQSLTEYWKWLGIVDAPPVQVISLGRFPAAKLTAPLPRRPHPRILSVGTIEGRKNHIALLEACEALWASGKHFELQLIGMARQDTGRDALAKIETLKNAGRSLIYNGVATRNELQSAYQECSFTVYPSLKEGFGLPVLESLDHGKPCICSNEGALGESARSGGCIGLATMDASTIETAIAELLEQSTRLKTLTEEAAGRPFRSWCDYAGELHAWVKTVRRRE